jgi:DNA-directed RNA polymerase subunit RPC12/RpoP
MLSHRVSRKPCVRGVEFPPFWCLWPPLRQSMSQIREFNIECDQCGQHIEGEMEGFERLIQCPTCSAHILARPTELKPTFPASSESPSLVPLPRPPPVLPEVPAGDPQITELTERASTQVSAEKHTDRSLSSCPSERTAPSTQAVTPERGKLWLRTIVTVIVTTLVLLAIGIPGIYFWQKRAQKTEQLMADLRLLEAQIQTGLSYNDFLAQVARVRATHMVAVEALTQIQEKGYRDIDSCFDKCADLWNPKSFYQTTPVSDLVHTVFPMDEARFGVKIDFAAGGEYGFNIYHAAVPKMLTDIGEDIDAFLKEQPCPWPK